MSSFRAEQSGAVPFSKMAGGGNDFVVIHDRPGLVADPADLTRRVCTRRLSVGADGLILVDASESATIRMRYWNADGSLADFCANGTRCAARFAFLEGVAPSEMTIETGMGLIGAEVSERGDVTLSLPPPRDFQASRPLKIEGKKVDGSFITVGVPHYVVYRDDGLWQEDIVPLGRAIRNHQELPQGANANFVTVRDAHHIDVRTYERGVEAETLSCGSGVVASVSVSALAGRVGSPVEVLTRSGITFHVRFDLEGGQLRGLRLRGDARLVYRAALTPETVVGFDPEFVRNPTRRSAGS